MRNATPESATSRHTRSPPAQTLAACTRPRESAYPVITVKTDARATAWPRPHADPLTKARSTLNTDASASHRLLTVGRVMRLTAGDHAIGDLAKARPVRRVARCGHRGWGPGRRRRKEADDRKAVAEHLGERLSGESLREQEALAVRAA